MVHSAVLETEWHLVSAQLSRCRAATADRYTALPVEDEPSTQQSEAATKLQCTSSSSGSGRGQLPTLGRQKQSPTGWAASLREAWADVRHVMGIATFRIIIIQVGR